MIIRPPGIAITQPDHAALASRIMSHWRANGLPESPRRDEILLAIAEHDNGWREVDDVLRVDLGTGAVQDFMTVPDEVKRGVWPRAIARLAATSPYAGALVAYHAAYVYDRYRPNSAWGQFFVDMDRLKGDAVLSDYLFLRVGDLISLVFCTRTVMQAPEFGYTLRLEGDTVIVSPDPFGGREVPLSIDGRELGSTPFMSAPRVTVTGLCKGAP